jgi:hypothetical protein
LIGTYWNREHVTAVVGGTFRPAWDVLIPREPTASVAVSVGFYLGIGSAFAPLSFEWNGDAGALIRKAAGRARGFARTRVARVHPSRIGSCVRWPKRRRSTLRSVGDGDHRGGAECNPDERPHVSQHNASS